MCLKFKCLILDHDDTAVNSTAHVHYPAHEEVLLTLRPGATPIGLEGWFRKNFHPGIMQYLTGELNMTEEEMEVEYDIWRQFTSSRTPAFFPGFLDVLIEYRKRGGIITVVSHSEEDIIRNHYTSQDNGEPCVPDLIFGWTYDDEKRKPSPWPVRQILSAFNVKPEETLILDDLKPGVLMGKNSGVPVAGAGWCHDIPEIREYMTENCLAYFPSIEDFRRFIFA